MIKSITRIKNFGVFSDYSSHAAVNPFLERNIIYGWNYSGKTTLSRVFHCLESKLLNPDYAGATFSLDDYSANQITNDNLHIHNKVIRIFNSDFIQKNLKWDGNTFDPILLLGEVSIETEDKIQRTKGKLEKCRLGYQSKETAIQFIESDLAEKKRKTASQIKTTLSIVEAFTAAHLDKLIIVVEALGADSFLLDAKEIPNLLKESLASDKDKLDLIPNYELQIDLEDLSGRCKALIERLPTFSSTINYLRDNPKVANWVEQGLELHQDLVSCEFCGNPLDVEYMNSVRAHFSKDLTNFKQELNAAIKQVTNSQIKYEEIGKGLFYLSLRESFQIANELLQTAVANVNHELHNLNALLERKINAPFDKVVFIETKLDVIEELDVALLALNEVINSSNEITRSFGKQKQDAISKLKNYYAAVFLITENITAINNKKSRAERHKDRYKACASVLKQNIALLEAVINKAQKGREIVNEVIADLLGGDDLQISVVNDGARDHFQLVRADAVAKNLSEGEKTAIAFSFFLTKLREEKNLKDVIVYIDDPISSLDSNHIFQVNAIIRDVFLFQDTADGDKWKTTCKQLFISTHNFEFLSLLKELPGQKGRQSYFQVKRLTASVSTFSNLPEAIIRFPSEYHYLYSLIRDFNNSDDKGNIEMLLSIPNAVRRFVELYTMSRLPIREEVDVRTEKLFGAQKSKRILKVLHYFSHLSNIERLMRNTDLICDIENAVNDLLELIKNDDPRHLESLETAIS